MQIHLVDGTYELFRHYYGAPKSLAKNGQEVGATHGLMRSLLSMLRQDTTTHVAVAFDQVIESFRNQLFDGYKTGEGIEPDLHAQFPLAERACAALGLVVWPMVEFEADDALATAAARWVEAPDVDRVLLCTPDKDLAQCVIGDRIVLLDRRRKAMIDEPGVEAKYGVAPASIPDWLALVGDAADGIPGIPRWGAKSAAAVLRHYCRIEAIPDDAAAWQVKVRGAKALGEKLRDHREDAMLYRKLATLRTDVPLTETLEDLRWVGADRGALDALSAELGAEDLIERVHRWRLG